MPEIKVANWNIEWMNRWFTEDGAGAPQLRRPEEVSGVTDLEDLCRRVAAVIDTIDPDVLTVQEGPSRKSEMGLFVRTFLGDRFEIFGPAGKGQQKLYCLVRRDTTALGDIHRITEEHDFDFEDAWDVDIDSDLVLDAYGFTRPPLVLVLTTQFGRRIRLLNIHSKSKYVHRGAAMWRDPARQRDFIGMALKARRRISAEAMRIREYLDLCFAADIESGLIVTGDFNDGPGLDFFERRYLTHSVAGMISGGPYAPRMMLRHAFIDTMAKEDNWTAEFHDFVDEVDRRVVLDHIFVSASLFWTGPERTADGTIEHDAFNAQIKADAPGERERLPSDHRPQSVTLRV